MDEKEIEKHYTWRIRYHKKRKESKEDILAEREKALQALQEMTVADLLIVYYMRHITDFPRLCAKNSLKKWYEAERETRAVFKKNDPRT